MIKIEHKGQSGYFITEDQKKGTKTFKSRTEMV